METVLSYLGGFASFVTYFGVSILLLMAFKYLYMLVTPHDEWKLVREDKNVAAAIGFIGAVIGFSLALASAASNSVSVLDFTLWGGIALLAQIIAFSLVRFILVPGLVQRIVENEVAAGVVLGGVSVSIGLLNAACMTY